MDNPTGQEERLQPRIPVLDTTSGPTPAGPPARRAAPRVEYDAPGDEDDPEPHIIRGTD
ncbi:hypothetical protein [Streptomyces huiliensis]|uniref:hypothetical protein n=1 Tax=Streptomyces huiliensis TaxID=2876027 RepID=UPI001CBE78B2|nr:hypothetical protein [Streptomyces huiliensis]MBZ4324554.1 hypothetical protein [Streptomyces huiliensis]